MPDPSSSDISTSEIILTIGGVRHQGWTEARITRSMEAGAGTFELNLTERWSDTGTPIRITPGDPCTVSIGGEIAISGYVDEASDGIERQSRRVTVSGRDRSADLVDCSAVTRGGQWDDITFQALAATLCRPFGIAVRVEAEPDGSPFSFKLQPGDSVWTELEREAARARVLMMPDGKGDLILTRAGRGGSVPARLSLPGTILAARPTRVWRDRYSEITVLGQGQGSALIDAETAAGSLGRARDTAVTRYRPLILLAETDGDGAVLQRRAEWEVKHRAAASERWEVTVVGHTHGAHTHGAGLWRPNTLVGVTIPAYGLDETLLLIGVEYTVSMDDGPRTRLTVARPALFDVMPMPPRVSS